jgi:phosphoserine phosphatase
MKLILIRHGQSRQNEILEKSSTFYELQPKQADSPLTQTGLEQARYTGQFLATEPLGVIFTSTLDRARRTANEIQTRGHKYLAITETQELNEKNERTKGIHQPETTEDFTKRVRAFHDLIIEPYKRNFLKYTQTENITIVGHGVFISVLTSILLGELIQTPLVYRNPNCAITRFECSEGKWVMLCQGSVTHLLKEIQTGVDVTPETLVEK